MKHELTNTSIKTAELSAFPENANPYAHDAYHMGQSIGSNAHIMLPNHNSEYCPYVIVINTVTGERIKVLFDATKADYGNGITELINKANGL